MQHHELMEMASRLIAEYPEATPGSIKDCMLLSIPEPKRHNGNRVRLFGSKGPLALIINGSRGRLTVRASARKIKRSLEKITASGDVDEH